MHSEEFYYRILKAIEANPNLSQRELAAQLGVSLGKANYCLRELVKKGLVKVGNFTANADKRVYAYLLTPRGVKEKASITLRFLAHKMREYEQIKDEIVRLQSEINEELC
jgi:EPS-associated MarR family transcriptional regulator